MREIDKEHELENIVITMVQMANQLKLDILAEGVETVAEADKLRALGCDVLQGYLFAKPAPLETFITWLAQQATIATPTRINLKAVS